MVLLEKFKHYPAWVRYGLGLILLVVVFGGGIWWGKDATYYFEGSVFKDKVRQMTVTDQEGAMIPSFAPMESAGMNSLIADGDYVEMLQKVVKTGTLNLDVKSTAAFMDQAMEIAQKYSGFIQDSNTWLQTDETTAGSLTLRVPVAQFELALKDLKLLATVVTSESISGQDVTEQYIDLTARLGAKQAEEAQYLKILSQATTVEDLLKVNVELSRVRAEIEALTGQVKYLENRTDLSTIMVYVYEQTSIVAPSRDWKPVIVFREAVNALVMMFEWLINVVIWLFVLGLPIGVLGGLGWLLIRRIRRR
ncbi:MAG: transmembrane anti-sigma factor [Candidatus Peregrinibacteria bacterium GW2011_GWE2_39_6]|nr:MAG: transmembrane anti-sigma factor [Candidatus Peregrinibacteria bacterium GW2011_GWF2_39_17]KKR24546.1 MAG: transmembrane anti-sigma factor [Candidatus Peregrinibacteria bacterium GW2011_GWE2_39_6]HCW32189.1 hypothetical protein [Candidatus Peregrinibacteria bacterium]